MTPEQIKLRDDDKRVEIRYLYLLIRKHPQRAAEYLQRIAPSGETRNAVRICIDKRFTNEVK